MRRENWNSSYEIKKEIQGFCGYIYESTKEAALIMLYFLSL